MPDQDKQLKRSLFGELQRRHVFAVGAVYFLAVWGLLQVADIVLPAFGAPEWTMQALILIGVIGFPITLVITWIFDITPKGLVRTSTADANHHSIQNDDAAGILDQPLQQQPRSELVLDERRQITVLCGDINYLTDQGDEPDPEQLLRSGHLVETVCSSVIHRFSGQIQHLGLDSFVVYFGFPEAHEEDTRRAVRCGLALAEGLNRLSERTLEESAYRLHTNLGIDSGLALVEAQDGEKQVLERVTRRAQWIADNSGEPVTGRLVISEASQSLVLGYFDLHNIGDYPIGGSGTRVALFQVQHESGARNRVEASDKLSSFSGRTHEFELLKSRWQQSLSGDGQIVLLAGEAGMGKSRLLHELKKYVAVDPRAWITECACSVDFANRPLYPIVDLFSRSLVTEDGDDATRLTMIEDLSAQFGVELVSVVPLFAELLGVEYVPKYEALQLAPKRKKELTIQAFINLMLMRAEIQPHILIIEDLHWSDPSFADLVQMLVQQGLPQKFLVVCTTRPNVPIEWAQRTHVTNINLTPLSGDEIEAVIDDIAQDLEVPRAVISQLKQNAQGNPLFAEELTLGFLRGHSVSGKEAYIPTTLQESLLSRLDSLQGEVKTVAKLTATLGPKFSYDLANAFAGALDIVDLDGDLRSLVDADIFYQRGIPPNAEYAFKHVLMQEAAYQTLLKRERESYHLKIADILEADFAAHCTSHPETLARHLTAGLQPSRAVPLWYEAGRQAAQQSAPVEAQHYLQQALTELQATAESDERNALELDVQIALGPVLMATKGYTSGDVALAYERAIALCESSTPSARLAPPIFGLWTHRVVAGELTQAVELGAKLLLIAEQAQSEDLLLESHVLSGVTLSYTGPMRESLLHMETAMNMYEKEKHAAHAYTFGQDPLMAAVSYKGIALWWLGLPDQAGDSVDRGIEIARELGHARSLAFSLANAARCHLKRGAFSRCIEVADEGAELCSRLGFPDFKAMAELHAHISHYQLDPCVEALCKMQSSLRELRSVGNSLSMPYYHSQIALACAEQGLMVQAEEALALAKQAFERHGSDCDESEYYRAVGIVAWGNTNTIEDPEMWLSKAVAVATAQGASAWQLQAAVSLARYRDGQGAPTESYQLLAAAREGVTEGFTLPIQQEADQLLATQGMALDP